MAARANLRLSSKVRILQSRMMQALFTLQTKCMLWGRMMDLIKFQLGQWSQLTLEMDCAVAQTIPMILMHVTTVLRTMNGLKNASMLLLAYILIRRLCEALVMARRGGWATGLNLI